MENPPPPPIMGGYSEIDKNDEPARTAADFAIKEQSRREQTAYKLEAITRAERQLVEGTNYRLCLKVSYHKKGHEVDTTESVLVVVNQNLQQEYSLTSWTAQHCDEESGGNRR